MPAFVKTPKDEARWSKAKEAAGKETSKDSESYWKLSNYIFHKMGKTEEDQKLAAFYKGELMKMGTSLKMPKTTIPTTSVKMPKAKMMPGAFDKPSKFFKSEDFAGVKHPSVEKLRAFLQNTRAKR